MFAGCSSKSDTTSAVQGATNLSLNGSITSPGSNVEISPGDSIVFNAAAANGVAPYNYTWSFPGGSPLNASLQTETTFNTQTVTFAEKGVYTASLTIKDSNNNTSTDTVKVTVTDSPTLTASIASPSTALSIGVGDTVSFSGQASGGSGTYSYTWSFPGGSPSSSSAQNQNDVAFNTAGTHTVTLSVQDSKGNIASDTVKITATGAKTTSLVASITSPGSDVTLSAGGVLAFTGQASGGTMVGTTLTYSYGWDIPGGTPRTATNASSGDITFSTAGTYTVTLTVADEGGNTATDTVKVTVTASALKATITSPAANITVESDATNGGGAGSGEKVDFAGIGSGGVTTYNYSWDIPGGSTRTNATSSINDITFATAGQTYTITFTVTDSTGTTATDTVTITTN